MKKVLLASTALAFTAGMAAAQGVSLSGYAEIGIKDKGGDDNIEFHHDMDVKFTLSGETDNGLTFGASIDLDELDSSGPSDGDIGADFGDHVVFVKGDFGSLTMGDTDGALDWAMSEVAFGTTLADDHSTHAGYNGNSGLDGAIDGQILRYDYSFGDFAIGVSAEIGPYADGGGPNCVSPTADVPVAGPIQFPCATSPSSEETWGIGVKYAGDLGGVRVGLGLGYQDGAANAPSVAGITAGGGSGGWGTGDIWGLSGSFGFAGGFTVRLNYSSLDGEVTYTSAGTTALASSIAFDWDHYAIGVRYVMDELSLEANYGKYDGNMGGTSFDADGWGVAFNYDLGGGAFVMVGYGSGTGFTASGTSSSSTETWSAGLGLNF